MVCVDFPKCIPSIISSEHRDPCASCTQLSARPRDAHRSGERGAPILTNPGGELTYFPLSIFCLKKLRLRAFFPSTQNLSREILGLNPSSAAVSTSDSQVCPHNKPVLSSWTRDSLALLDERWKWLPRSSAQACSLSHVTETLTEAL